MATVEHDSRTPSLTNSECTLSSSGDYLKRTPPIRPNSTSVTAIHINDATPFLMNPKRSSQVLSPVHSNRTSVHSRASTYYGYMNGFIRAWSNPAILAQMLSYIQWKDFQAVIRTCRSMRTFFFNPEIRDVTLARFIPGYQRVNINPHDDVTVTLTDLEILIISSQVSLSSYPKLAVDILSRLPPSPKLQFISDRFVRFTQVHSRFILLLHSQAPRWQYSLYTEEPIRRHLGHSSSLRELTFPPPLSYFDVNHSSDTNSATTITATTHRRLSKNNTINKTDSIHNNGNNTTTSNSISTSSSSSSSSRIRLKSLKRRPHSLEAPRLQSLPGKQRSFLFGHKDRPPPPLPQSSPPSLKYYSLNRRRQVGNGDGQFISHSRYITEALHPPRYPVASNSTNSLPASLGSSSASSLMPRNPFPAAYPHELGHALFTMRAPILRVFVPCSSLDQEGVIIEAEHQLITGGLWEHLRTGDAVLNLGYVPTDSSLVCGWFIFGDGHLNTYFPPALLPVSNFGSLPSPLYYAHISQRSNVRSFIRLPRLRLYLELIELINTLPSPDSPQGLTRVKHYVWIGKMNVREEELEPFGLGDGWAGEWTLEAPGTYEGRQSLIDSVEGQTPDPRGRQWEIVGEKTGLGKLWLRMCPEPKLTTDTHGFRL